MRGKGEQLVVGLSGVFVCLSSTGTDACAVVVPSGLGCRTHTLTTQPPLTTSDNQAYLIVLFGSACCFFLPSCRSCCSLTAAADEARQQLSDQIRKHLHKAKKARVDEAVGITEVTLNKLIAVNAVELLSAFPADLWKQLHTARKQVGRAGGRVADGSSHWQAQCWRVLA